MNERIKQLAEEAGIAIWGDAVYMYHPTDTLDSAVLENFAELIVKECSVALSPMLRDMISRGQGVDLIKLHFGMNPNEITTAMLDAAITQCEQELAKKKSGVEE